MITKILKILRNIYSVYSVVVMLELNFLCIKDAIRDVGLVYWIKRQRIAMTKIFSFRYRIGACGLCMEYIIQIIRLALNRVIWTNWCHHFAKLNNFEKKVSLQEEPMQEPFQWCIIPHIIYMSLLYIRINQNKKIL